MSVLNLFKIKRNRFLIFNDISIHNADSVNVIISQLARNLFDILPKSFKVVRSFIMITHTARRHEIRNIIVPIIALWREMIYLHFAVFNFTPTISAMPTVFLIYFFSDCFIETHNVCLKPVQLLRGIYCRHGFYQYQSFRRNDSSIRLYQQTYPHNFCKVYIVLAILRISCPLYLFLSFLSCGSYELHLDVG